MNINNMLKIIEDEQLDVYTNFVYGSIYTGGEYSVSFLKDSNGTFRICAVGERGKVIFDEVVTDENYACQKIVNHMRIGKKLCTQFSNGTSSYNRAK